MEKCDEYSYGDIRKGRINELARCIYARNGSIRSMDVVSCTLKIRRIGRSLTLKELPTYFYYVIYFLREYPENHELLYSATTSASFDFESTPPALAYLVLDAMRSAYGDEILKDLADNDKVAFAKHLPWSYKGEEALPTGCEMARDEYIVNDWEWLAACRYAKNGEIRLPASST